MKRGRKTDYQRRTALIARRFQAAKDRQKIERASATLARIKHDMETLRAKRLKQLPLEGFEAA